MTDIVDVFPGHETAPPPTPIEPQSLPAPSRPGIKGDWSRDFLRPTRWLGAMRAAGSDEFTRDPVELGHNRLIVAGAMIALAFFLVALRLVDVTILMGGAEPRAARVTKALPVERADILDRRGVLVATSLGTASLFADPRKILDPVTAAKRLAQTLPDLDEAVVRGRLQSAKGFVYLRRNLTPRQEFEVNRLGIPGLSFQREDKRVYPQGAMLSHVLGFSDIDNHGLAGLEKGLDQRLRESPEPLELAIDVRVQSILHDELATAAAKFNAIGAGGIVMDARTGEILAMVSLPEFDPNNPGATPPDNRFNRMTLGVYEMGSVFKTFTAAMALDTGVTSLAGGYDASHPIQIAGFTIHDDHPLNRFLSVPEIFKYSSNIGSAKMAVDVGVAGHRAFLERLGMLSPAHLELPEIGHPHFPVPWRPINTMTIAFGHGLSVSPLQVVTGVAAVVNGGILVKPTLLKRQSDDAATGPQVISMKTSDAMRKLMRLVVLPGGTGEYSAVDGYVLGGKTGTAEKLDEHGHYKLHVNMQNYVAAFPITNPRYIVWISIDEGKGNKDTHGFATAGWIAAPSAGHVISRIGPMLGVEPVDENSPQVVRALAIDNASPRLADVAAE